MTNLLDRLLEAEAARRIAELRARGKVVKISGDGSDGKVTSC